MPAVMWSVETASLNQTKAGGVITGTWASGSKRPDGFCRDSWQVLDGHETLPLKSSAHTIQVKRTV